MTADGPKDLTTDELFDGKKVVLFSPCPARSRRPATPSTCRASWSWPTRFSAKGVDTIACLAVNDVFVMKAWGKSGDVGDKVLMLADGNGDYTRALGLELDATGFGMGERAQRFAMRRGGRRRRSSCWSKRGGEFKVSRPTTSSPGSEPAPAARSGTASNRSPTRPKSATSKIGASRILVDRDDGARVLDAREVLDGAGDADRDVQLRRDDLAGLAHLQVVGRVACVHRRARCTDGGTELVGQLVEHLEVLGAAQRPTAGDDARAVCRSAGRSRRADTETKRVWVGSSALTAAASRSAPSRPWLRRLERGGAHRGDDLAPASTSTVRIALPA